MSDHPYLEHSGIIAFAHRGGNRLAPENTLAAFQAAADMGYRYLETDVHAASDGTVYAFHDPSLERMTGDDKNICDLNAADIDSLRIDGDHAIPRLTDLLEAFPDARFNIDAKADSSVAPLVEVIKSAQCLDRVGFCSFSRKRTARLEKALGSAACITGGPFVLWKKPPFTPHCIQTPIVYKDRRRDFLVRRIIKRAHRRGLQVHAWTINDEADMRWLIDLNIDGIMTDDIALLKRVLEETGHW